MLHIINNYYKLGTTTKQSMPFQVPGLWLHLKEVSFLGLGLNGNNVGMACQKVCKQDRDDIEVAVNIQSPIPASFPY